MKAALNPRKILARRAKKNNRNVKATLNPSGRQSLERAAKVNKTLVIEPSKSNKNTTSRLRSSTLKAPSVTATASTAVAAPSSQAPSKIKMTKGRRSSTSKPPFYSVAATPSTAVVAPSSRPPNKIKMTNTETICRTLHRRLQMQDFGWMFKNKSVISKSDLMAILSSPERTRQLCKHIVQELYRTDFDFSETYALESLELVDFFFLHLLPGLTQGRWYFIHHLARVGIVEAILIKLENIASLALQRQCLTVLAELSDCPPISRKLFHPRKLGVTIYVKPLFSLMLLLRGNIHDPKVVNPCCFILYNYCLNCPNQATRSMIETPDCLELLEWASHCSTADNYNGGRRPDNGLVRKTINEIFKRMMVQMYRSLDKVKTLKHRDDELYDDDDDELYGDDAYHCNRPRTTRIYDIV